MNLTVTLMKAVLILETMKTKIIKGHFTSDGAGGSVFSGFLPTNMLKLQILSCFWTISAPTIRHEYMNGVSVAPSQGDRNGNLYAQRGSGAWRQSRE